MQEQDKLFRRFPLIAAAGLVVITLAACAIELRSGGTRPSPTSAPSGDDHSLAPKLEECLTVTPEQTATFEYCRRVWAENRAWFFGHKKKGSTPGPAGNGQSSSEPAPKDQGRLPQGYPPIATPDQE
jgi:conjugative transfer region protein TrbK